MIPDCATCEELRRHLRERRTALSYLLRLIAGPDGEPSHELAARRPRVAVAVPAEREAISYAEARLDTHLKAEHEGAEVNHASQPAR